MLRPSGAAAGSQQPRGTSLTGSSRGQRNAVLDYGETEKDNVVLAMSKAWFHASDAYIKRKVNCVTLQIGNLGVCSEAIPPR